MTDPGEGLTRGEASDMASVFISRWQVALLPCSSYTWSSQAIPLVGCGWRRDTVGSIGVPLCGIRCGGLGACGSGERLEAEWRQSFKCYVSPRACREQGLQPTEPSAKLSGRYQGLWSQNPDGPLAKISSQKKSMVPLKFYTWLKHEKTLPATQTSHETNPKWAKLYTLERQGWGNTY